MVAVLVAQFLSAMADNALLFGALALLRMDRYPAWTDPLLQEYEKSLLGDPVKDRAKYEAASPIQFLRKERAPLLVMQGERDIRVPREEAAQVVDILKKEGRTVDAVYYPQEGHGFMKREDQIDEITRMVAWFEISEGRTLG